MSTLTRLLSAAVAAIGLAASIQSAAAQTTLRVSSWAPPTHPVTTEIFGKWAADVERVTEGRVKTEMLGAPLGAPPAYFDLVSKGIVDVSFVTHDFLPNRFVLSGLSQLPFSTYSAEISSVALWRTHEAMLAELDEHKGVKVLALMVHGPGQLYTISKPVTAIADFAGLKVRASAAIQTEILEQVGGSPVSAPPTKSYEVMANGVVDGTLFPPESMKGFNLIPLVKHELAVPGGFYTTSFVIMMNEAKWDGLSDADKEAIMSVSGEYLSRRAGAVWDASDEVANAEIDAAGVERVVAEGAFLEELKRTFVPLEASWIERASAKGLDAKAALEFYRAEVAREMAARNKAN
ncbi:TRAP transporter substrate-binding protein [Microbaculum sp. FT89]|uniref:TRAP transporter substrate-binding protein n=1 Tax=Microbaculum sp. FT89 TaxID=3447298 RepID=UPI003F530F97